MTIPNWKKLAAFGGLVAVVALIDASTAFRLALIVLVAVALFGAGRIEAWVRSHVR